MWKELHVPDQNYTVKHRIGLRRIYSIKGSKNQIRDKSGGTKHDTKKNLGEIKHQNNDKTDEPKNLTDREKNKRKIADFGEDLE